MTKADLVSAVAETTGVSKKDTDAVIKATIDTVTNALAKGDKIQFVGFGTFETKKRNARTGRNPKSGEEIKIPASVLPSFKAGKALKDAVNS